MTITSSMIINDDQSDPVFSPLPTAETPQTADSKVIETSPSPESLLAEIQAIQESLQSDADFDFSTLEPTSAGITQNTANDKSLSSPILLEDPGLSIHYRSNGSSQVSPKNEESNPANTETNEAIDESFLTAVNESSLNQIQASVSEDFITQAKGQFSPNLNVDAQSLETPFGSFSSDALGNWQYNLNNQLADVQSLSSGDSINDIIKLTSSSGQNIQLVIEINGNNDQAIITGTKLGEVQAAPIENLGDAHPSISGKLNVSDTDSGEARFETNFNIQTTFGAAQINAQGEWTYTLNNNADAIQGLRSGEKLLDLFSVKTLDGTKQLIQINIDGVNDKPLLSGDNVATLDLGAELEANGSLLINDPDFGESSFQTLSSIRSSLGYGTADIDSQGNWTFNIDIDLAKQDPINEGQTRTDSFEVFTQDGTSQMVHIRIVGSDSPFYDQDNITQTQSLALHDLIQEENFQDELSFALNQGSEQATFAETTAQQSEIETTLFLNSGHDTLQTLSPHLNDINIS